MSLLNMRVSTPLPINLAAGTNGQVILPAPRGESEGGWEFLSLDFVPDAAASLNGTNYFTMHAEKIDGTVISDDFTTSTSAQVKGSAANMSAISSNAAPEIPVGGSVAADVVHTGSGMLCKGTVVAHWRALRATVT